MRFLNDVLLIFLLHCCLCVSGGVHVLDESLKLFQTIHKDDLKHRLLNNGGFNERLVELPLSGRTLRLHLKSDHSTFSKGLEVYSVNESGIQQPLFLNRTHFYTGTVFGHEDSSVVAHLPEDDILTASISLNASHTYYIERSQLRIHESHDYHMIAYLESDVRWNFSGFQMDSVQPDLDLDMRFGGDRNRLRRAAPSTNTDRVCSMALVADYRFMANYAMGSTSLAASLMVVQLMDASTTYRKARFRGISNDYTNFGLQVRRVIVHSSYTDCTTNDKHYNCDNPDISSDDLLKYFSFADWSNVCLAHLFTYYAFSDQRVGLAYIGETNNAGGVCATTRRRDSVTGRSINYNTAFSSYLSPEGRTLLQREGQHATTHEIGHGWGGQHDPADRNSECNAGGPYVMYPFAVDGSMESHRKFSKCSEIYIGRVLEAKGDCFEVTSSGFCGNGIIDGTEQCDRGRAESDSCCDGNCQLISPAICSDRNHVCCQNCQPTADNRLCGRGSSITCIAETRCDGNSYTCPEETTNTPVGGACFGGRCQSVNNSIVCVQHCTIVGLDSCLCSGGDACLVCCEKEGVCAPYVDMSNVTMNQSDGYRCLLPSGGEGICENNACRRLQDFQISIGGTRAPTGSTFGDFLARNVVGTILFIMFMIFLVPSCAIHWLYDRKYYQRYLKNLFLNQKRSNLGKRRKSYKERKSKDRSTSRRETASSTADNSYSSTQLSGQDVKTPLLRGSTVSEAFPTSVV